MVEPSPNQVFCNVPIIHFYPDEKGMKDYKKVVIPLYRNPERKDFVQDICLLS